MWLGWDICLPPSSPLATSLECIHRVSQIWWEAPLPRLKKKRWLQFPFSCLYLWKLAQILEFDITRTPSRDKTWAGFQTGRGYVGNSCDIRACKSCQLAPVVRLCLSSVVSSTTQPLVPSPQLTDEWASTLFGVTQPFARQREMHCASCTKKHFQPPSLSSIVAHFFASSLFLIRASLLSRYNGYLTNGTKQFRRTRREA